MQKHTHKKYVQTARRLRKNLTGPERCLWQIIRARKLAGLKFRRQHPISPYIVDFFCKEYNLIIELDGNSHDDSNYTYDLNRQCELEAMGFKVLRVTNDDVLYDTESVVNAILKTVKYNIESSKKIPSPLPLGEG